ncbi:MAG: putative HtrA2 peptidase [Candidatus Saccharibacteria bacterium]|nr:putative HtrA2 peptidase [Candidatus Saccharibacteria bacterium]
MDTNEKSIKKTVAEKTSPSATAAAEPPAKASEQAPQTRPARQPNTPLLTVVFLLIMSLSAGFLGGWYGGKNNTANPQSLQAKQQIISSESQLINSIAKSVGPSVVSINTTGQSTSTNPFFGLDQTQQQQSAGTGLILNGDGVIITNRHVVPAGTTSVSVVLSDGTELKDVSVLGRTSENDSLDIAFLKINDKKGKTLTPAKLGDSNKLQVGDKVIAIGNALGEFQNTVTSGIISGFNRSVQASGGGSTVENLQDLVQTDTAINPGNSGGPLVNTNGEVIGINTAIAGNAQNIGFAIPINDVQGVIKSMLQQGKLLRPYVGVRYVSLTDALASQYGLSVKRGAYIAPPQGGQAAIIAGSPAEKAGLKEKDVITKVDNTAIDDSHSLTSLVGQHSVGDTVTLTIIRDGKQQTVKVTLEALPAN